MSPLSCSFVDIHDWIAVSLSEALSQIICHGWLEGRGRDDFVPGGVDGAADVERGDDVCDGEPDRAVREHLPWADPVW